MFIIDFFKSLFKKKEYTEMKQKEDINDTHSLGEKVIEDNKKLIKEAVDKELAKVEEAAKSSEEEKIEEEVVEEKSDENTCSSDISESISETDSMAEEEFEEIIEEKEEGKEEPSTIIEEEVIDPVFSSNDIAAIKDVLRPIVKSYNYEKKYEFAHYAEVPKTIKCFLTAVKDSQLLIFRPTQSDAYNNEIGLFVRKCILKDFKDGLVAAGINNLDIQCDGGKIKIKKKI